MPIDKIHLGEIYLQNAFFFKSSCNDMIENRNNIKNRVKRSFREFVVIIAIIDKFIDKNVQGFVLIMLSSSVGYPTRVLPIIQMNYEFFF